METNRKMSEEEIRETLKCCINSGEQCNKCELNGFHECIALHPKDILDLLNSKDEIIEEHEKTDDLIIKNVIQYMKNCYIYRT